MASCASSNGAAPAAATTAPATTTSTSSAPGTAASIHATCTIGGTPFKPAYAKREDDEDDNAVRVFIFAAAPANAAETKSACDRAKPIPAFAEKSDKRIVEVDFNDASNLTTDYDVLFLTKTDATNYMHDQASTRAAELSGTGASQTIHVKAKNDDADCEVTIPVSACPTPPR